jgi:enoyl-CoA hydratase/carnithine racemase
MGEAYTQIRYEAADGLATITLHRPEKLNAYTLEMGDEVVAAFAAARGDAAVRAVILTGSGRAFCAGVDLDALKAHLSDPAQSGRRLGEEDFLRVLPLELLDYPKPVIAAINGAAIGVGVTMTLPCDVRLASREAKLGLTFARLGLLPGLGSTHLLPRLVGPARARELVLSARVIPAEEAAAIGLVNRVVSGDALLAEARALAAEMAKSAPEVLAAAKAALRFGESAGMAEAMKNEREASERLRALRGRGAP